MNALARNIAKSGVDQALALQARCAGEGFAHDLYSEVRFATAIIASMAVVARAIIDDSEVDGGKGFAKKPSHFLRNRSVHDFHL